MSLIFGLNTSSTNLIFDTSTIALSDITVTASALRLAEVVTLHTSDLDLTLATTITATVNGVALSNPHNITANSVSFDAVSAGLKLGDNYQLTLTVDGQSGQVSKDFLAPLNHAYFTLISIPSNPPLNTYAGAGPDNIGIGDQPVYDTTTGAVFSENGDLSFPGGGSSGDKVVNWSYLDAQDSFSRSSVQTFTLLGDADTLTVNSVSQTQQINNAELLQLSTLNAFGVSQSSSLENVGLTQAHILTVDNLAQASSLESALLVVSGSLAVSEIKQEQAVGAGSLTQQHSLSVSGVNQTAVIESTLVSQINTLIAQNIKQQQVALEPQLDQNSLLNINSLLQSSGINSPVLSILGQLLPGGLTQSQLLNAVLLTQQNQLLCNDLAQAAKLENITLDISQALTVLDVDQAQSLENTTLNALNIISVDTISQAQLIDVVRFGGAVVGYLNGRLVMCSSINGVPKFSRLTDKKPTIH